VQEKLTSVDDAALLPPLLAHYGAGESDTMTWEAKKRRRLPLFRRDLCILLRAIKLCSDLLVDCSQNTDTVSKWIQDADAVLKDLPGALEYLSPSEPGASVRTFTVSLQALRDFEDTVNQTEAAIKSTQLGGVNEYGDDLRLPIGEELVPATMSLFTSSAASGGLGASSASGSRKRRWNRDDESGSKTESVTVPTSTLEGMLDKLRRGAPDIEGLQEDIERMLTMSAALDEPGSKRSRNTVDGSSMEGGSEM
jgi:hypothetical protein